MEEKQYEFLNEKFFKLHGWELVGNNYQKQNLLITEIITVIRDGYETRHLLVIKDIPYKDNQAIVFKGSITNVCDFIKLERMLGIVKVQKDLQVGDIITKHLEGNVSATVLKIDEEGIHVKLNENSYTPAGEFIWEDTYFKLANVHGLNLC